MAFNYAKERREFDREWERLRREYEAAGMTTEHIDKLYAFDLDWFNSRRSFFNHTQELPGEAMGGRFGWVDEIEDARLADKLRGLSAEDLELLTLLAIEGYTQTEAARMKGCSQNAVSKKYLRIKKVLK